MLSCSTKNITNAPGHQDDKNHPMPLLFMNSKFQYDAESVSRVALLQRNCSDVTIIAIRHTV